MRHVAAWAAWWIPLFWLWFLLVGEWNLQELVAAASAATIAASLAEYARTRTGFHARVPLRGIADVPQILVMVVADFGILAWVLASSVARRHVVRGRLVSRELERGSAAAVGAGPRAWTAIAASYSPNAYVLDVDPETRSVLLHDLVPRRQSERPA